MRTITVVLVAQGESGSAILTVNATEDEPMATVIEHALTKFNTTIVDAKWLVAAVFDGSPTMIDVPTALRH